jgi:uncharacterized protein (TIGR01741 family)
METQVMEQLYQQAAVLLNKMIPEPWEKIYLHAEIGESSRQVYFYYFSNGQERPVLSLDIPDQYEINVDDYNACEFELYDCFTNLWEEFKRNQQEPWTHLTFMLDHSGKFKIDYGYEDLSEVNEFENRIIWEYKYLGLEPDDEWEKAMLKNFKRNQQQS